MKPTDEQIHAIGALIEKDATLKESLRQVTDANTAADVLEKAAQATGIAFDRTAVITWLQSLLSVSKKLTDDELDTVSGTYYIPVTSPKTYCITCPERSGFALPMRKKGTT